MHNDAILCTKFKFYFDRTGVLRGVVIIKLGSQPWNPGLDSRADWKSFGGFSYTPCPCLPSSEWVPGVIRGFWSVSWAWHLLILQGCHILFTVSPPLLLRHMIVDVAPPVRSQPLQNTPVLIFVNFWDSHFHKILICSEGLLFTKLGRPMTSGLTSGSGESFFFGLDALVGPWRWPEETTVSRLVLRAVRRIGAHTSLKLVSIGLLVRSQFIVIQQKEQQQQEESWLWQTCSTQV